MSGQPDMFQSLHTSVTNVLFLLSYTPDAVTFYREQFYMNSFFIPVIPGANHPLISLTSPKAPEWPSPSTMYWWGIKMRSWSQRCRRSLTTSSGRSSSDICQSDHSFQITLGTAHHRSEQKRFAKGIPEVWVSSCPTLWRLAGSKALILLCISFGSQVFPRN
ncbi:hypothetical protein FIBSPDRAFT_146676 [Athelia psychrophila]|uniref:Uncharacterized protein n=1 Tax=Athelia psychrophila TaxID=1759441 RepID=A0A166BTP8_9AGAM|nr:hypothetical protein FIBSPDRAFT_146676 [Fibularhizoctonia sp. CBS 109695]